MDAGLPGDDSSNKHYGFLVPVSRRHACPGPRCLSLVALIIASLSIYRHHLQRTWRRTYAITAVIAFYFNVFVLVVQLFRRVPALKAMAPTQSEPPFQMAQLAMLLLFAAIGIRAATGKPQRGLVP
jgi:hypothetical protein